MSHELRTPLHTIIGFAELLAEELEVTAQRKTAALHATTFIRIRSICWS